MNSLIKIEPYEGQTKASIFLGSFHRDGPLCQVEEELWIVGNDHLCYGCDVEFTGGVAALMAEKLRQREVDCIMTAASKSIGFAYEIAKKLGHKYFAIARKNISPLPDEFLEVPIYSMTSGQKERLLIDKDNIDKIRGKKIALFDDTVSTGKTMVGLKELALKSRAQIEVISTVWTEGASPFKVFREEFNKGKFIWLGVFPLFAKGKTYRQLLLEKQEAEKLLKK